MSASGMPLLPQAVWRPMTHHGAVNAGAFDRDWSAHWRLPALMVRSASGRQRQASQVFA